MTDPKKNELLSDIRLDYKELEEMRKNLITKTLRAQRHLSAEIERLQSEFQENVKILESLADKQAQPQAQPEGVSL